MVTHRRTAAESNRCSEAALCTDGPALTTRAMRARVAGAGVVPDERSCRRLSGRDASSEDVQTQLVKEHPRSRLDLRAAERPAAREQLASRLAARFSRLHESREPVSSSGLVSIGGGLWRSGSVGRSTPCGERSLPSPWTRVTEARVNGLALDGLGAPFVRRSVRFRAPPTDCLPIEMKPEHARE
jgi:hypothetical protein